MTKNVALLITFLCVCLVAGGQIMFKLVANRATNFPGLSLLEQWLTWQFIVALAIYGVATVMWVWVLRFIPLNVAYPVYALAFLIVPIASYFLLTEPIGLKHLIGGSLIVAGVFVMARG
jgi:multidrug transporter EmrE-like cation transporter